MVTTSLCWRYHSSFRNKNHWPTVGRGQCSSFFSFCLRKLIATTSALLCNTLSEAGVVHVQPCSVLEFHAHVVREAQLIKEAMVDTSQEAENIMSLPLGVSEKKCERVSQKTQKTEPINSIQKIIKSYFVSLGG